MLPDPSSLLLIALLSKNPGPVSPQAPFRFATATVPPPSALMRAGGLRPIRGRPAKKATAAVAGAILGFFGGALAGAGVGSLLGSDDPDNYMALQGGWVGGMAGAGVGALLAFKFAQ